MENKTCSTCDHGLFFWHDLAPLWRFYLNAPLMNLCPSLAISCCLMLFDSSNIRDHSRWRPLQGAFGICITQCFQEPYSLLPQLSDQAQLPANAARQWTLRLCMIDHRTQGVKLLATFSDAILRPHVHDLGRGIEQVITQVDSDWKRRFRNESWEAI